MYVSNDSPPPPLHAYEIPLFQTHTIYATPEYPNPFPISHPPTRTPFPLIHHHVQSQEEWATATASTFAASGEVANGSFRNPARQTLKPHSVVAGLPPSFQAAQAALKRKYRHLRRALGKDGMLFADEIFEIRPLEGDIWARSEIEVRGAMSFRGGALLSELLT